MWLRLSPNTLFQFTRAVTCINTNRGAIAPMVIANPVSPLKKNAYENSTQSQQRHKRRYHQPGQHRRRRTDNQRL